MTQAELNRAVATGGTASTIASIGLVPLNDIPIEWEPRVVDWDDLDSRRVGVFLQCPRQNSRPYER